jgi:hypothetical protein
VAELLTHAGKRAYIQFVGHADPGEPLGFDLIRVMLGPFNAPLGDVDLASLAGKETVNGSYGRWDRNAAAE